MTSAAPAPNRRAILVPLVAVLAAATLGVSAAFGGLEEAPDKPLPQLGKGASFDQGQVKTVFEDAVIRPGRIGLGVVGKRYLQLVLKVTNQTDDTISAQAMDHALPTVRTDTKVIKPSGDPGDFGPRIVVIAGDQTYGQLHPGVPETVVMSFELAAGAPFPKTVRIDAGRVEWHEFFSSKTHAWVPVTEEGPPTPQDRKAGRRSSQVPAVAARVAMPVRVENT
ncbi:hypothetical protein Skr01_73820 [Sphaerisporangium krabiense]|uniref:DUF4352 domain-containing protein n=1 Tax=Sphaerisporangium krabiense TaxID=763782 RepID=A0A7W9DNL2_9ACTN|nr:hypothetical protein [Sphaerisporangium krabiense]MBB5625104.1 hypothetical protein [Sphaerisporangium krabiense]GII67297.1 hypothetical protein Skr01_73820 [Sphaerisporangium krabiense]